MATRHDTTVTVPRTLKAKMADRKPDGVTWGYFLTKELGLEDMDDSVSAEDAEEVIRKFSEAAAETAGVSPDEIEEAVRSRLEEGSDDE